MFGLLTPAALFGLALVSIPVAVHLFRPRRVRATPFSSLRWLRPTRHRFSRRLRWHRLLLMALRIAFLVFLAFALAGPIHSGQDILDGATERIIVVDTSRSMGYRPREGPRPIERATRQLERLLSDPAARRRTSVVVAGAAPFRVGPLVGDPLPYLPPLRTLDAETADGTLTAALPQIDVLLADRRPGAAIELLFITDHQAAAWNAGGLRAFTRSHAGPISVGVIDVGPGDAENVWVASAACLDVGAPPKRILRVRVASSGRSHQQRTVTMNGLAGAAATARSVALQGRDAARFDFDLPPHDGGDGAVATIRLEPADRLPDDDVFHLPLDRSLDRHVLIVADGAPRPGADPPALHLTAALDTLADTPPGGLRRTMRTPSEVRTADLAGADLVVMAGVPSLDDPAYHALHRYVVEGGSLVLFLGPAIQTDFYDAASSETSRVRPPLMAVRVGGEVLLADDTAEGMTRIRRDHPLFLDLLDPVYGDLAGTRFERCHRLELRPGAPGVQVLAHLGDTIPAVVEWPCGKGRVLLFNTTANDTFSDLSRRRSFVPMVQRMVRYLAGPPRRMIFVPGRPVVLRLPRHAVGKTATITPPGGESFRVPVASEGVIHLRTLTHTGIHQVEVTGPGEAMRFPFVVQTQRRDSAMQRGAPEAFRSAWHPAQVAVERPDPRPTSAAATSLAWTPWCILAAAAALLAEMFLVHRLCPGLQDGPAGA